MPTSKRSIPMHASVTEKLFSASASVLVVALLFYLLLCGLSADVLGRSERSMTLVAIQAIRREPPQPMRPARRPHASAKPKEGSPRGLRSKASAIVIPPPLIPSAMVPPTEVPSAHPESGPANSSGTTTQPGTGEGSGGQGRGAGAGGDGNGGGDDVPPRQIKGHLKFSDLPADVRDAGAERSVSVRYQVGIDGRVGNCTILVSSGSSELDQRICQLIQQRFRFDPSRTQDGQPVPSIIEERHSWKLDRDGHPSADP